MLGEHSYFNPATSHHTHFHLLLPFISTVIPLQTLQTRTAQKVSWMQGDISLLTSTKNFTPLSVTQQSTLQSRHRGTHSLSPLVALCADLCIVWGFHCNKYQNYPKQPRKQIRSLKICTGQQTLFGLQQHSESHNIMCFKNK